MVKLNVASAERTETAFLTHKFPDVPHLTLYAAGEKVARIKAARRRGEFGNVKMNYDIKQIHRELQERQDAAAGAMAPA